MAHVVRLACSSAQAQSRSLSLQPTAVTELAQAVPRSFSLAALELRMPFFGGCNPSFSNSTRKTSDSPKFPQALEHGVDTLR